MTRAFVTGATGFVGANLVAGLNQRGHQVRLLHRDGSNMAALRGLEFEPVTGDILGDESSLVQAMRGCSWIFHLAAVSDYWRQDKDWLYRVNVEGTRNVLNASKRLPITRFIHCSSLAALLPPHGDRAVDELNQYALEPEQFPYGHTKRLAELEVLDAVNHGMPAVIVNPTIVMGPGDLNEVSGSILLEAKKGRLHVVLPGGMNVVAVEDVVAGLIGAAEKGRIGERYVLAGTNITHWRAAEIISEIVGVSGPWFTVPMFVAPVAAALVRAARRLLGNRIPLDENQIRMGCLKLYADGSKAAREFGITPTPFESVIRSTYKWYQRNGYTD